MKLNLVLLAVGVVAVLAGFGGRAGRAEDVKLEPVIRSNRLKAGLRTKTRS